MYGRYLFNISLLAFSGGKDADLLLNFVNRELGHFFLYHVTILRKVLHSQELLENIHGVEEARGEVSDWEVWCHFWANSERLNW